MADDPIISSNYAPTAGPFSSLLQSGLVPGAQQQTEKQPSGFIHTAGKAAFLGTKILEGLQRGKVLAYASEQARNQQRFTGDRAKIEEALKSPNLTDKQREDLQTLNGQLVARYLHPELTGDDGSGKSKSKSKKDQGPLGEIKGVLGNIVGKLAGPDLPKTGGDNSAWVDSELHKIGAPGKQAQVNDATSTLQAAIAASSESGNDRNKTMGLKSVQDAWRTLFNANGQDANKTNAIMEMALAGTETKAQQTNEKAGEQNLKLGAQALERGDLELAQIRRDEASAQAFEAATANPNEAPPPNRNDINSLRTGSSGSPGVPLNTPIPEEKKTPGQKANESLNPSDINQFLKQDTAPPPDFMKRYQARTVWATGPSGESTPLYTFMKPGASAPTMMTGDYRYMDYAAARSQGWKFDSSKPLPPPSKQRFAGARQGEKAKFWFQENPKTGAIEAVLDPKTGKQLIAQLPPKEANLARQAGHDLIAAQTEAINGERRIKASYNGQIAAYDKMAATGTVTDKAAAAKSRQALVEARDSELAAFKNSMGNRMELLKQIYGGSVIADRVTESQSQDEVLQVAPGTRGSLIQGLGDKEE